jgi:hypothetical protein
MTDVSKHWVWQCAAHDAFPPLHRQRSLGQLGRSCRQCSDACHVHAAIDAVDLLCCCHFPLADEGGFWPEMVCAQVSFQPMFAWVYTTAACRLARMTVMAWTWRTVWWLTTSAHSPSPLQTAHAQVSFARKHLPYELLIICSVMLDCARSCVALLHCFSPALTVHAQVSVSAQHVCSVMLALSLCSWQPCCALH